MTNPKHQLDDWLRLKYGSKAGCVGKVLEIRTFDSTDIHQYRLSNAIGWTGEENVEIYYRRK